MQFITQCAVDCAYAALTTTVDLDHPELTLNFVLLNAGIFHLHFLLCSKCSILALASPLPLQRILIDLAVLDRMNATELVSPRDGSQRSQTLTFSDSAAS